MKPLFIIFVFFTSTLCSQSILKFDKQFVQSEDRWVALQKGDDTTFTFGFIYIDAEAGLTLDYGGSFTITDAGEFVPDTSDRANFNFKIRLQPNKVLVAFIPEEKFAELNITAIPEWLKHYKTDTASVERLYKWGFMYNGWNECAKGLTYLEKAQKADPDFEGLSVELAYSYNCLGQYENAISVLQNALKKDPADAYVNKELIYAQIHAGQLEKASASCQNALKVCKDKTYNAENYYNLLHAYYAQKDKVNFNLWLAETKKLTKSNPDMTRSIKAMEDELGD